MDLAAAAEGVGTAPEAAAKSEDQPLSKKQLNKQRKRAQKDLKKQQSAESAEANPVAAKVASEDVQAPAAENVTDSSVPPEHMTKQQKNQEKKQRKRDQKALKKQQRSGATAEDDQGVDAGLVRDSTHNSPSRRFTAQMGALGGHLIASGKCSCGTRARFSIIIWHGWV